MKEYSEVDERKRDLNLSNCFNLMNDKTIWVLYVTSVNKKSSPWRA